MNNEILVHLFERTHGAIHANLAGLVHTDSLVRPQPGGNSLNWVVGHIVATRNALLRLLGREAAMPAEVAARYERGSSDVTDDIALPLTDLVVLLDRSQEELLEGIAMADTKLARGIALLNFHESYHAGQVGLLRRMAGKPGAIA